MVSASPAKRAVASALVAAVSLLAAVRSSQAFTAAAQHQRPSSYTGTGGRHVGKNNDNHIKMATNDLDFDFSSARGWESHYQGGGGVDQQYDEWHATIDFDTIVRYCPPKQKTTNNSHPAEEGRRTEEGVHGKTVEEEQSFARFPNRGTTDAIADEKKKEEAENGATTTTTTSSKTRVLMIGCGTSRLPEAFDANLYDCTLLDAAPTCIDTLRRRYGDDAYTYIVGDALRLHRNHTGVGTFDYVVDKGLMDALLCGEGWSLWVRQLLDSVHNVLSDDDDDNAGRYILVSYRLPSSTMAFLQNVAGSVLEWNFQVDGSNPRVMISIARRRQRHHHQQQPPPPQQQHRWRALDQRQGEEEGRSTTTGHHHHRRPAAWDMICNNYNNHEGQFNVDDNGSRRQRVTYDSYWDE
jgi:hypothetical protein